MNVEIIKNNTCNDVRQCALATRAQWATEPRGRSRSIATLRCASKRYTAFRLRKYCSRKDKEGQRKDKNDTFSRSSPIGEERGRGKSGTSLRSTRTTLAAIRSGEFQKSSVSRTSTPSFPLFASERRKGSTSAWGTKKPGARDVDDGLDDEAERVASRECRQRVP
ncbi:hypothetical protein KM043_012695 [Ampulex compressa]|nr:hypothetical protein KM043_012695 [Ampulex compressa]